MDFTFNISALEKIAGGSDAYVHRVGFATLQKSKGEQDIASLQLPAGSWVVLAKAVVQYHLVDAEEMRDGLCRLTVSSMGLARVADSAEDHAELDFGPGHLSSGATPAVTRPWIPAPAYPLPITLLLGVDLGTGGYVHLRGRTQSSLLIVSNIVIGAMRVNSLTVTTIEPPPRENDPTDYNPDAGSRPIANRQQRRPKGARQKNP